MMPKFIKLIPHRNIFFRELWIRQIFTGMKTSENYCSMQHHVPDIFKKMW